MMTILFLGLAWILLALGFLGCFVAKIPGPLVGWLGVVIISLTTDVPIDWWMVWLVLPILIILSMFFTSRIAPGLAAKVYEFGKAGKWGTFVGSMLAILLAACRVPSYVVLICLVVLPYVFAFLFELISVKNAEEALKRGGGSYVLYLLTTFVKLIIVYICFALALNNVVD